MIDEKDLQLCKPEEIKPGYTFYLKNEDGSFSRCVIEQDEIKDFGRMTDLKWMTLQYLKQGRLFRRINKPGQRFEV